MTRHLPARGFYGIGIEHGKTLANVGTLWRTATTYGAAFVFTVGGRYERQSSDTLKTPLHTPLYHYDTLDDLIAHLPWSCPLVGVELDPRAVDLHSFSHPERACYLLGAEDHGLTSQARRRCHSLVQLPGAYCLNVAVAGSIVMYERHVKSESRGSRRLEVSEV